MQMGKLGEKKAPAHLRRKEPDLVFGVRRPLPANMLPLTREVGQALAHEAEESRRRRGVKELRQEDYDEATSEVSRKLAELYGKASIPTVKSLEIRKKVKQLWELRKTEQKKMSVKSFKGVRRQKSKNGKVKVGWNDVKDNLFEVADKDKNVSNLEKPFLLDQRSSRKMVIGNEDKKETKKIVKKLDKKEKEIKAKEKEEVRKNDFSKKICDLNDNETEDDTSEKESSDSEVNMEIRGVNKRTREEVKAKRKKEENIVETMDRFAMSSSSVAHLINEVKAGEEIITEENMQKVLTKSNISKMKKRVRKRKFEEMKGIEIEGLMIDERIDKTRTCVGVGEKGHKRFKVVKEEHCAVVGFGSKLPGGSCFLGHMSPELRTGRGLAQATHQFTLQRQIKLVSPGTTLSDGCSKLAGHKTGVHAELEELRGEALQRVFCVSHMLERPWAKLFEVTDGKTSGPESWTGPIGQEIVTPVWERPLVQDFEAFPNPELLLMIENMSPEVLRSLKHDYIYMIEMGRGLMTGHLAPRWAEMQAGTCSNVRWTNPQSRTARLWMSTASPTSQHRRLCFFLVYVYIPTLIESKMRNTLPQGPVHFLSLVRRVELHCTEEEKEFLQPILQFNSYQAHPECVLLAMLASEKVAEREKGVKEILRLRSLKKKKPRGRKKVRKWKVSQISTLLL